MLEAQGFAAVRWVDASGKAVGNAQFIADPGSGTATLILPRSAFGDISHGWVFTVVLTGQDGFSSDQARGFQATPQDYQFGVCKPGGTSPICAVRPDIVAKVMDTITPSGVSQVSELDRALGPVVLQGVTVP
jgi:glucoamylase